MNRFSTTCEVTSCHKFIFNTTKARCECWMWCFWGFNL